MSKWQSWMMVGALALVVGACGKGATPTAQVALATATATSISSPTPTAVLSSTPFPPTPSLTPRPPGGYPAGITASPLPFPTPTPRSGYPVISYPTPVPTAIINWFVTATQTIIFPPDGGAWVDVQCENGNWRVNGLGDANSIFEFTPPVFAGCPVWTEASPDAESAVLVTQSGDVYLWRGDGTPPINVGHSVEANQYTHPRWSPDSHAFAFVITATVMGWPNPETVGVVDGATGVLNQFSIEEGGMDGEDIYWLAPNVLCRGDRNISPCHKASTGEPLFDVDGWHIVAGSGLPHQLPNFSPNMRWVLLDQAIFTQDVLPGESAFLGLYSLYDIERVQGYPLPPNASNPLAFAGWAADNSRAYLISRPTSSSARPALEIPYGLLSLDPQTRQLTLLFKQAVYVSWNPTQEWALVIFPSRNADGVLELSAGVWQVGTEFIAARMLFSKEMIYADPGWDAFFNKSSFGDPLWSPDGQWVVFGDPFGELTLIGTDGTVQPLAADASGASWLDVKLRWSPAADDRLLVQHGSRAWVVTLP